MSQGKVQSAVFSFRLAKTGSELYLGGTNPNKFSGSIEWHPITSKSYWVSPLIPLVSPIESVRAEATSPPAYCGATKYQWEAIWEQALQHGY